LSGIWHKIEKIDLIEELYRRFVVDRKNEAYHHEINRKRWQPPVWVNQPGLDVKKGLVRP